MTMEPSTPQQATTEFSQVALYSLAGHIERCFSEAQTAKQPIIDRMLACERQRRGEYEPSLRQKIQASGGQEIFMMLTDIKCRAADSWIKDVIQNSQESTWAIDTTIEPDVPPEVRAEVTTMALQEAAMVAASGIAPDPQAIAARESEIHEEVKQAILNEAKEKCRNMERRIGDKLQEGGWNDSLSQLIYDFTTYPSVFVKGPVLRKKKVMTWGPGFRPIVSEVIVIDVDRVSPWDIFPSPGANSTQDGYLIQRHRLTRKAIRAMRDMKGAHKKNIESVLEVYRLGLKTQLYGEMEHERLNGREISFGADGKTDALEYWGPASGLMLREWGMTTLPDGKPIDDSDEYQVNAWKIGGYVVRAMINPDPLDQRPYSKASFEDIPGAFWGKALPELMADVQTMCNAAARALAANMGIASGPQVEVHTDRLAAGETISSMFPWKIWQTKSDRTGAGHPAIHFFQPNLNAQELLAIFQHFSKIADEVTGVPNYVYGSSNVSGAGRTASGLSMLMENAAKGIKHAILNLDKATTSVITRIYNHLMMFDPDQSIKGDMQVVPAGAIGAMIREQQEIARKEFMADTLNPIDMQVIGIQGRAHMLRERAKPLFPDAGKIVPSDEQLRMQMVAQQQAAAQQQTQQPKSEKEPATA